MLTQETVLHALCLERPAPNSCTLMSPQKSFHFKLNPHFLFKVFPVVSNVESNYALYANNEPVQASKNLTHMSPGRLRDWSCHLSSITPAFNNWKYAPAGKTHFFTG